MKNVRCVKIILVGQQFCIGFVVWRYPNSDWFLTDRENPVQNADR